MSRNKKLALSAEEACAELDRLYLAVARAYQSLAKVLDIDDVTAAIKYEQEKKIKAQRRRT